MLSHPLLRLARTRAWLMPPKQGKAPRSATLTQAIIGLLIGLLTSIALAKPPSSSQSDIFPSSPQLRLNPKMHTAAINRVDVDKAQGYAVTASNDKSVLLWELASGKLLRRLRLPAGPGDVGKAYAVAISPDGESIAVGGRTGKYNGKHYIYIFQRASGALLHTIEGLGNAILHLAYSPKGQYLAASLKSGEGLYIYRSQLQPKNPAQSYRKVFADNDYGGEDSYWLSWHGEKQLLSSAYDGHIRLYQLQQGHHWRLQTRHHTGGKPFALAPHPKKARVAVGFVDSTKLMQLSLPKLQPLAVPNTEQFTHGSLSSVSWSHRGQRLCAGGRFVDKGNNPLLCWRNDSGRKHVRKKGASKKPQATPQSIALTSNTLMDVRPLQDGGFIAASGDGLSRIDKHGKLRWQHLQPLADFRGQVGANSLRLSEDGGQVAFGFKQWGKQAAAWDMARMRLIKAPPTTWRQNLSPALTDTAQIKVTDWINKFHPKLNGAAIQHLDQWERSRRLAIKPPSAGEAPSFVLGTNWSLRHINQQGQQLWHKTMPGEVWTLNISGDGRWVVAGLGDGTLRWYELATGEEKLALFAHNNQQDWVLWTPEGFFASSGAEANKLAGFQLNNGAHQAPDFIAASQLYNSFYRPDMVLAKFQGEEEKVQQALAGIGDVREVLKQRPPLLALRKPLPKSITGTRVTVPLKMTDQGGGIGEIEVYVNGILRRSRSRSTPLNTPGELDISFNIPSDSVSDISIQAKNGNNKLSSEPLALQVESTHQVNIQQPRLFGLAIGVENYQDGSLKLNYAIDDIKKFKGVMEQQSRHLYREVKIDLLPDATLAEMNTEFKRLSHKNSPIGEQDVFVLFLSGHGVTDKGNYHFLPQDFIWRSPKSLKHTLSSEKLNKFLAELPAQKAVVFMDTCYAGSFKPFDENDKQAKRSLLNMFASRSGNADKQAISQIMAQQTVIARLNQTSGRAVFYASSQNDVALEGYQGNGLYTHLLVQGLSGKASNRNYIDLYQLQSFLEDTMPVTSKQHFGIELHPMAHVPANFKIYSKAP